MTAFEKRIVSYMDAAFPILYINTFEEAKAKDSIVHVASMVPSVEIIEWDGTDRVCDLNSGRKVYDMLGLSLTDILDDRLSCKTRQVLVLENVNTFMDDPSVMARLKKFAEGIHSGTLDATIFILSPVLKIPKDFEKYITILEMDYLKPDEIYTVIEDFLDAQAVSVSEGLKREFANAFKGLSEFEIQNILQLAYSENGELLHHQVSLIFEQKQQMIKKAGILEMVPWGESMSDIGGLDNLKKWLERKAIILSNMEKATAFGVDVPKGVLIAGVPGCGKSLSAKAAARLFHIPLLRLDMGRLMGKYVGESEANMRKAISLAEAISPCVLWIDELEKAFAGINGDSGGAEVITRLFGSFLTWLQEKDSLVFVVATANDITKLPPELLRKGRFDDIFYVGLPQEKEREKIFEIHIGKRRKQDLPIIKKHMKELAEKTKGYSGADIEGVVREGIENAYTQGKSALSAEDILAVISETHSLSELMKDSIERIENEYKKRKFKNASRE